MSHEWTVKFVGHRVADRRVLRLIRKWLRAGVSEEGNAQAGQEDTGDSRHSSRLLLRVWFRRLVQTNQAVPGICARFATSSFISTPMPGRSGISLWPCWMISPSFTQFFQRSGWFYPVPFTDQEVGHRRADVGHTPLSPQAKPRSAARRECSTHPRDSRSCALPTIRRSSVSVRATASVQRPPRVLKWNHVGIGKAASQAQEPGGSRSVSS